MSKSKKTGFVLSEKATMEDALAALKRGDLSQDQFMEWDKFRSKSTGRVSMKKTGQQISQDEFLKKAGSIVLEIQDQKVVLAPRQNSSGSLGWGSYGKMDLTVGDKSIKVQCSLNLVVVGSKG